MNEIETKLFNRLSELLPIKNSESWGQYHAFMKHCGIVDEYNKPVDRCLFFWQMDTDTILYTLKGLSNKFKVVKKWQHSLNK